MQLIRIEQNSEGTFGELYLSDLDEDYFAVTVERPAGIDFPCIPAGVYHWRKFNSPNNGPCLLLENVPGRTMIEMHSANFMLQLRGCIAPGKELARFKGVYEGQPYDLQGVTSSKDTMERLLKALPNSGVIEITEEF